MKIRIPARQKRDTTRFCGRRSCVSSLRLLQLSLFTFCFLQVASFLFNLPSFHMLFLNHSFFLFFPNFHSLPIISVVLPLSPLLSDKLFVGCNLSQALLSCSQVLSLSLFLCLSILQRATAKKPFPLSLHLSQGVTISSLPWLSQALFINLTHQNTNTMCLLTSTYNMHTLRQYAVLNIHPSCARTHRTKRRVYTYTLAGARIHAWLQTHKQTNLETLVLTILSQS